MTNQSDLLAWCLSTFGRKSAYNPMERAARLIEEAAEAVQAAGLSRTDAFNIVQRVYSRPPGEVAQEIGGCAFTLATFAEFHGLNAEYELQREFDRVQSIDPSYFRAKHAAKVADGCADLSPAKGV